MTKLELLETYLSLYINHFEVLKAMEAEASPYVILDVRNAPAHVKKDQIKARQTHECFFSVLP